VKDRRTLVMIAILVVLGVIGAFYAFAERDNSAEGGSFALGGAAIVALLLLAFVGAGASRNKRVVRDEEERKDG
jgi:hypothetical protein